LLDNIKSTFRVFLPVIFFKPYSIYDRTSAVTYADRYAHDRNDDYPNYGSDCNCNDCTNYISQILHQGGYPLKTGNWDENSVFEWWFRYIPFHYVNSKTWSTTDWFSTFLFQYPEELQMSSWPTELDWGDFFLMDLRGENIDDPPDGIPDHARIIIGYGFTSIHQIDYTNGCGVNYSIPPQLFTQLVNQHCIDRKHVAWDYMVDIGVKGIWPWHIIY
jgi:hypothetical protein